jgi:U3 small nucleolar RNA-associated protein 4
MRDTGLTVWRILNKQPQLDVSDLSTQNPDEAHEKGWERVLDMELNVHTNLIASAISNDGHWLVASDLYETKLFHLTMTVSICSSVLHPGVPLASQNNTNIKPRRIRNLTSMVQTCLPSLASTGGSAFCFTPDSSKLVMATAMSANH